MVRNLSSEQVRMIEEGRSCDSELMRRAQERFQALKAREAEQGSTADWLEKLFPPRVIRGGRFP